MKYPEHSFDSEASTHLPKGYKQTYAPNHPLASSWGLVYEHVLIAERALGRPLPARAEVHHSDGNPRNNERSNLVICQDRSYHQLLHARLRVLRAGGKPNTDKICSACRGVKQKSDFSNDSSTSDGLGSLCRVCNVDHVRRYRARKRAERRAA